MHLAVDCRSVHRHMGGIGRAALELVQALASTGCGHKISMIIGSTHNCDLPPMNATVVPVEAGMIDESFEQHRLPSLLAALKVDLYLNTTFSIPSVKTTRHQVAIIHDVVFEDRPDLVEPRLRSYLSKWSRFSADQADHLLTVSDHARDRIMQVYSVGPERITRVYNGIGDGSFTPPAREDVHAARARYNLNRPYILYLGALEAKKGLTELLAAFTGLSTLGFAGDLVLAGHGDETYVRSLVAGQSIAGRVRFLGYIDESLKKPLLMASSCFVYPSLYEGFGLPPLEAMALGIPTVVSDRTSLPEVVGDAALISPVHNVDRFARTLHQATTDSAFRARAETLGPARARRFKWTESSERILGLCEALWAN